MRTSSVDISKNIKKKDTPQFVRRMNLESLLEHTSQYYNPLESPHILRLDTVVCDIEKTHCRKLFEDSTGEKSPCSPMNQDSRSNSSQIDETIEEQQNQRLKNTIQALCNRPAKTGLDANKENSRRQQIIGFNASKILKFPETPRFKQLLSTPFLKVDTQFNEKIVHLRGQLRLSVPINAILIQSDPQAYLDLGYKFFMGLAESKRKQQCNVSARALYKISLFMQPYDESCWEWAVKFQEDLGNFSLASKLAKTGYLFTKSDNLAEKYVHLKQKTEEPLQNVSGIVLGVLSSSKPERIYKTLYELARLEWLFGDRLTTFKILYFLVNCSDCNVQYLPQLTKFYESEGKSHIAYELLLSTLSEKNVKIPIVYSQYLKLAEDLLCEEDLPSGLEYLRGLLKENIQGDTKWRLLMEIGQIYWRLGKLEQARYNLATALELAPNLLKMKVYLTIMRLIGKKIPTMRVPHIIVDINRDRFLNEQAPLNYPFQEWKYFFHYSLFYLIDRDQQALELIRNAAARWPYSGRLAAEILFIDRTSHTPMEMLPRWTILVNELPKSGEVWCEGGRIYVQLQNWERALFCFESAIRLTPQYGDPFIEAYKLRLLMHDYRGAKQYKYKVLLAEPFYGNVWSYLKFANSKSSIYQNWKRAKRLVKESLYRSNIMFENCSHRTQLGLNGNTINQLTSIDEFNNFFLGGRRLTRQERQYLFFAYDQMEPHKY